MNTGIAAATGMYVKVVDADELGSIRRPSTRFQPRCVHSMTTDEPIDMLVTNYVYSDKGGQASQDRSELPPCNGGRSACSAGMTWAEFGLAQLHHHTCAHLPYAGGARFRNLKLPDTRSTSISITRTSRSRG